MKHFYFSKPYFIFGLLTFSLLCSVFAQGYVVLYPGVEFYNDDLTIGFSNTGGINVSYIEVGDSYVVLGEMNLSLSCSGAVEVNISQANSAGVVARGTSILRFNTTYTGSSIAFTFYSNNSRGIYKLYTDGSLTSSHEAENFSWTKTGWSTHDFDIRVDGYRPDCPTGASSSYNTSSNTVNLTWTAGTVADSSVVFRRNDTYPTSPTDSSAYIVQNSTSTFYNTTLVSDAFFTVWSYNNSGTFSLNSCRLNLPWGAIRIQVKNESNYNQVISPFGILISNSAGTSTYQLTTAISPLTVDIQNIPYGTNTIIVINATAPTNATGYKDRTYYKNLVPNHFYNFTFYLPPFETEVDPGGGDDGGSGDDFATTQNYIVQVIDDISNPIQGAKVIIRRYLNESYTEVASAITDGYGQTPAIPLIPGVNYKVNVSADNYNSLSGMDWKPVYIEFSDDRYKIFRLTASETDFENETSYDEEIIFNGHIAGNTGYVNFSDASEMTVNTTIMIYETNHSTGNISLYYVDSRSADYSFQISFSVNTSNTYTVYLHLNHTIFNYIIDSFILPGHPWSPHDEDISTTTKDEFNDLFNNIFGDNPFTWSGILGLIILMAGLFSFGQRNAGLSLLITGFVMLGFNAVIGLDMLSGSICILLIILGILLQWKISRRLDEG